MPKKSLAINTSVYKLSFKKAMVVIWQKDPRWKDEKNRAKGNF